MPNKPIGTKATATSARVSTYDSITTTAMATEGASKEGKVMHTKAVGDGEEAAGRVAGNGPRMPKSGEMTTNLSDLRERWHT